MENEVAYEMVLALLEYVFFTLRRAIPRINPC